MILAGDVGGTKCSLGLFVEEGPRLRSVFQRRVATTSYGGFEDLVGDFLERAGELDAGTEQQQIEAAGFGLAVDGRSGLRAKGHLFFFGADCIMAARPVMASA